jgi:hypothetical protein
MVARDECLANDECLRQTFRLGLHLVAQVNAELGTVAQQRLESGHILRRGDDQNIPYARQHQRGERVVNHRFVIDRQKLLAGDGGQRIQPGTDPAG